MHIMHFTERPYKDVPEDEVIKNRSFFGVPNTFYDAKVGADLYNEYLDEACYAEEVGFDAIMLNEHHGTPFCMGAVMNVEAAILARITKKVRIVLLGNPLPIIKHPVRMAEELAEIDLISKGRLVPGWVRGAGSEQIFNNANPAYNREYFNEAHDVIIARWTRPGPFRWEGKHFNYRFVNPWALPYQKPYPPIWIPGVISPETVVWCAEHRYPYIGLGTALQSTVELWTLYSRPQRSRATRPAARTSATCSRFIVAETEEKAQEQGKAAMFGGGAAELLASGMDLAAGLQLEGSDPPPGASGNRIRLPGRDLRNARTARARPIATQRQYARAAASAVKSRSRKRRPKSTRIIRRRRMACRSSSGRPRR